MRYDYFIAAKWTNLDEVMRLTHALRAKGKRVYCFAEDERGEMIAFTPFDDLSLDDPMVIWAYDRDTQALRDSESLIMLMPAGKSSHIEAGMAFGLGKTCILIGDMGPTQGLYRIFGRRYESIDAFLADVQAMSDRTLTAEDTEIAEKGFLRIFSVISVFSVVKILLRLNRCKEI